jgi:hypothetical protein
MSELSTKFPALHKARPEGNRLKSSHHALVSAPRGGNGSVTDYKPKPSNSKGLPSLRQSLEKHHSLPLYERYLPFSGPDSRHDTRHQDIQYAVVDSWFKLAPYSPTKANGRLDPFTDRCCATNPDSLHVTDTQFYVPLTLHTGHGKICT